MRLHSLFLVSVFVLCAGSLPAIEILPADEVFQGQTVQVRILCDSDILSAFRSTVDGIERMEIALVDWRGRTHGESMAFQIDRDGLCAWYGLLGISSIADPGLYTLRIRIMSNRFGLEERMELSVREHSFNEMRLQLGRALTALLTEPNQERLVESRQLQEILGTVRREAVYHTGVLTVPVVANRISAQFGDRRTYVYADGRESTSVHWGTDFAAATGTAVDAAGAGRVVLARDRILSGKTVILEHLPGVYSLYYHLDSLSVAEGQFVETGVRIGTVGMTGFATGPHVHWELRVSGQAVDPMRYLEVPLLDMHPIMGTIHE